MQFDLNRKWKANEAQLSPKLYRQLQTQHPTNLKRKSHILNQLHLPSIHDWKTVSSQVSMDSFKCIKAYEIITKDTLNHQNYIEDHSDQLKQLHKKFATYACESGYSNVASMHRLW